MQTIIDDLRPGDKFNIATFSDYVYYWEKEGMVEVTQDTLSRAKDFVNKINIVGGTVKSGSRIFGKILKKLSHQLCYQEKLNQQCSVLVRLCVMSSLRWH